MILRKIYLLKTATLISILFFLSSQVADAHILVWVPKLSAQINKKQLRKNLVYSNLGGEKMIVCRGS